MVHGVVLLAQEAHVVGQAGEAVEQPPALGRPTLQHVVVGQPERAGQEHALAAGQAVDLAQALVGVAPHEPVVAQVALHGGHRSHDPFVGGR